MQFFVSTIDCWKTLFHGSQERVLSSGDGESEADTSRSSSRCLKGWFCDEAYHTKEKEGGGWDSRASIGDKKGSFSFLILLFLWGWVVERERH